MLITKDDIAIFNALHPEKGAQWLPGHWLAHQLNRVYLNNLDDRLRDLWNEGYLDRNWPNTKISKHSSWARTPKADAYLLEKPMRSRTGFEHQVLDDMDSASLFYGVSQDARFRARYVKKLDIDFEFDGGNKPIEIATANQHIFRFKEIDRNTEQARHTRKSTKRRTIQDKIENIKHFHEEKEKHGIDKMFVSFITINDGMAQTILEIIQEVIGPCKYIGVATWKDWGNHKTRGGGGEERFPKHIVSYTFTTPYERYGYPPMELNRFWEC
jgi:hypothetical protein